MASQIIQFLLLKVLCAQLISTCHGSVLLEDKQYDRAEASCGLLDAASDRVLDALSSTYTPLSVSLPWLVQIHLRGAQGQGKTCTGTVVNERWVLTTGHCVENMEPSLSTVVYHSNPAAPVTPMKFDKIPRFNPKTHRYDLALVDVMGSGQEGSTEMPACVGDFQVKLPDSCLVIGGGENGVMLASRQPVEHSDKVCKRYRPKGSSKALQPSSHCVGTPGQPTGISHLDPGSTLLCKVNGKYVLYGVISFYPNSNAVHPTYFTDVRSNTGWMNFTLLHENE